MSGKVFLDYDQAELELQYNSAARAPEIAALRDREAERTAALCRDVVSSVPCRLDIPYGNGSRETLDLFLPDRADAPLMVFIHGGYWKSRDKSQFSWLAKPFVERGIGFATLGYPLCPDVRFHTLVASVMRGLVHVESKAAEWGFDPGRIGVSGHSAGGHLAAMAATTDWRAAGARPAFPRCILAVSGLYDLRPLQLVAVNADLRLDTEEVATLSPVTLPPRTTAAVAITVGGEEAAEFKRNAADLARAWSGSPADLTVLPAPGKYHFDILQLLGSTDGALFQWAAGRLAS